MLKVKRRSKPMLAVVVAYNEITGRAGRVLASEEMSEDFSAADLSDVAKRLISRVPTHDVILPVGIDVS